MVLSRKKEEAAKKSEVKKQKLEERKKNAQPPESLQLKVAFVSCVVVYTLGWMAAKYKWGWSTAEGRPNFLIRLAFCFTAQSTAVSVLQLSFLRLARLLDRGAVSGGNEFKTNDESLKWPPAALLPAPLQAWYAKKPKTGNMFPLNHVSGANRFRQMWVRIGMALGSVCGVGATSFLMEGRTLAGLGLFSGGTFNTDLATGFGVGVAIVAVMFLAELALGWVYYMTMFEVAAPGERFLSCFSWEVVFHLAVAVNEELPLRGWLLLNMAEACAVYLGTEPLKSMAFAMLLESTCFVVMHLGSPGGNKASSMINIFIGGMAGGLNVLLTGNLGFALGWHFGWNITMGNVLGLSTSGIPISATVVSVVPDPRKEFLHGGVFGPEGGLLAPLAYLLGIALLAIIYGTTVHTELMVV